jgi:hypothetical protein
MMLLVYASMMPPKSALGYKAVNTLAASYATFEWILMLIHMPILFAGSPAGLALSCVIDVAVMGELKVDTERRPITLGYWLEYWFLL